MMMRHETELLGARQLGFHLLNNSETPLHDVTRVPRVPGPHPHDGRAPTERWALRVRAGGADKGVPRAAAAAGR